MSQLRVVLANESGNGEVPIADGTGSYSWASPTETGSLQGWQAETNYTQGEQISNAGQLYFAATDFTSGSSFAGDGANWVLIGQLSDTVVQTDSADLIIPEHVSLDDFSFDLCRPPYNCLPVAGGGGDISAAYQQAILDAFNPDGPTGGLGGIIYPSQIGTYLFSGAQQSWSVTLGGDTYSGSAQILIPGIANGGASVVLGLFGIGPGYFISGATNAQGAMLKSNATSGNVFQVIPGYASNAVFGFSNVSVYVDKLALFINSTDPQCGGFNFQAAAKFAIRRSAVFSNGSAAGGLTGTGAGVTMPPTSNQGLSTVDEVVVRGMPVGYRAGEHGVFAGYVSAASCNIALQAGGGVIPNKLVNFNAQGCKTQLDAGSGEFLTGGVFEGIIHCEGGGLTAGVLFVNDPGNNLTGKITKDENYPNSGGMPSIGGLYLDVQDLQVTVAKTTQQSDVAGRGSGWMTTHPHDDFQRSTTADPTGSIPGACSKTNHPWFIQAGGSGAFTRTQGALNGTIQSTVASGFAKALVPALRGGVSRMITATVTPGTTNSINLYGQQIEGGANTGNRIELIIANNQFGLYINGSAKTTLNSATVSGTPVNLALDVLHDSTGLPFRIQGLVNGLKKGDYFLSTIAEMPSGGSDQALFVPTASGTSPIIYDGFAFDSDILSTITEFQVLGLGPLPEYNPVGATVAIAEASGAGFTPDPTAGTWQTATVADSTGFTIGAPLPHLVAGQTQKLTIEILNSSGGAMGTITWNSAYKFAGLTWANPANGLHRRVTFEWNGVNWIATGFSGADY